MQKLKKLSNLKRIFLVLTKLKKKKIELKIKT